MQFLIKELLGSEISQQDIRKSLFAFYGHTHKFSSMFIYMCVYICMHIIPGSFSFFIFVLCTCTVSSIIPTSLFLNGRDMTPTSGANATKIPVLRFYCCKIQLMSPPPQTASHPGLTQQNLPSSDITSRHVSY